MSAGARGTERKAASGAAGAVVEEVLEDNRKAKGRARQRKHRADDDKRNRENHLKRIRRLVATGMSREKAEEEDAKRHTRKKARYRISLLSHVQSKNKSLF